MSLPTRLRPYVMASCVLLAASCTPDGGAAPSGADDGVGGHSQSGGDGGGPGATTGGGAGDAAAGGSHGGACEPEVHHQAFLCGGAAPIFLVDLGDADRDDFTVLWNWQIYDESGLDNATQNALRNGTDCKLVDGGTKLLTASSSGDGGSALVDIATKKLLWYGKVKNAHSADYLPGGFVAVAGSSHSSGNGSILVLFDSNVSEANPVNTPLQTIEFSSAHSAYWDDSRQRLYVTGHEQMGLYRLDATTPQLQEELIVPLPDRGAHDLAPVPGTDNLILSTRRDVWLFDREHPDPPNAFTHHPEIGDLGGIKGLSVHPATGQLMYVKSDPGTWHTQRFGLDHPGGETPDLFVETNVPSILNIMQASNNNSDDFRLYKARWTARACP